METIKHSILEYYKTHHSSAKMNFYDLQETVAISTENLNKFLIALLHEGFICDPEYADNVIYLFRLKQ